MLMALAAVTPLLTMQDAARHLELKAVVLSIMAASSMSHDL